MSADLPAEARGISLPLFVAGLAAGWVAPSAVMGLSPAWLLRKFIPEGGFYEFVGGVVAISFVYLFWLAGARWPTSSGVARFGFAIGLAAFNYLAVLYSMFILRALTYGL